MRSSNRSKSHSHTQNQILLSDLIEDKKLEKHSNGGVIEPIPLDPSDPSDEPEEKPIPVQDPLEGWDLLQHFIQVSRRVLTDLQERGMVNSTELKSFKRDLGKVWRYWDELNSRWFKLNEDGIRSSVLKVIKRWSTGLSDHMEFLQDTSELVDHLYHSGDISEDDREEIKIRVEQFQETVLGLRKRVYQVKGY